MSAATSTDVIQRYANPGEREEGTAVPRSRSASPMHTIPVRTDDWMALPASRLARIAAHVAEEAAWFRRS